MSKHRKQENISLGNDEWTWSLVKRFVSLAIRLSIPSTYASNHHVINLKCRNWTKCTVAKCRDMAYRILRRLPFLRNLLNYLKHQADAFPFQRLHLLRNHAEEAQRNPAKAECSQYVINVLQQLQRRGLGCYETNLTSQMCYFHQLQLIRLCPNKTLLAL
jgi:hypothetical protein